MTVNEAIARSSATHPSEAEKTRMITWLSELEARISLEIFGKNALPIGPENGERMLIVPTAYAEVYPLYLMMQRELLSGDEKGYEFYSVRFKESYKALWEHVLRTSKLSGATYITTV